MLHVLITPQAIDDLEQIWVYTFKKWSLEQADYYQDEINKSISNLAANPTIGKMVISNQIEYLKLKVHHHLLFFKIIQTDLIVVRILHEVMDVQRHL
jgi:toxin ParE1/3/4